jgi:hypothetical protein
VVEKAPALKQYPHLVECVSSIVEEAKSDLNLLKEIAPRRFFYSKHFLALRMLLTRKLAKLTAYSREGWLADEDCDNLKGSLWDRILAVGRYVPKYHKAATPKVQGSRKIFKNFSRSQSNANLDAVMPVPVTIQAVEVDSSEQRSAAQSATASMHHNSSDTVMTGTESKKARLQAVLQTQDEPEKEASTATGSAVSWRLNFQRLVEPQRADEEVHGWISPRGSRRPSLLAPGDGKSSRRSSAYGSALGAGESILENFGEGEFFSSQRSSVEGSVLGVGVGDDDSPLEAFGEEQGLHRSELGEAMDVE